MLTDLLYCIFQLTDLISLLDTYFGPVHFFIYSIHFTIPDYKLVRRKMQLQRLKLVTYYAILYTILYCIILYRDLLCRTLSLSKM